jgi:MraZ protein
VLRLRGNAPATVDDKGRLKLPSTFKADLEAFAAGEGGGGLRHYLTSLDGKGARLYP